MRTVIITCLLFSACATTLEVGKLNNSSEELIIKAKQERVVCVEKAMDLCVNEKFLNSCLMVQIDSCNAQYEITRSR